MKLRPGIAFLLLALTIMSFGCGKEEQLPQIYTTHWKMPEAVQVKAQFKQFSEFNEKGRKYKGYTFTVIAPEQFREKEVSFELTYKEFDPAKLIPGKMYLVTVPKENIGTTDLVCDWGLEYKEPK
jgi:hypothetical protein